MNTFESMMTDSNEAIVAATKRISSYTPLDQFTGPSLVAAVNDACECFRQGYNKLCIEPDTETAKLLLENVATCLRLMRNACARGNEYQQMISDSEDFYPIVNKILFSDSGYAIDLKNIAETEYVKYRTLCWQTLANMCVGNQDTQNTVWEKVEGLMSIFEEPTVYANVQLMLLHNLFINVHAQSHDLKILRGLLKFYEIDARPDNKNPIEHLYIFLERYLTKYYRLTYLYTLLNDHQRVIFLYYVADFIRSECSSEKVPSSFLLYLSKEFKKKSEVILNSKAEVDSIKPKEVLALLDVIALASGAEKYDKVYVADHSLFLNIGGLLQAIAALGKGSNNVFTPLQKLQEVAPNSSQNPGFEREVSFELKSMLVRALANLLYRNQKNQDYARDIGIIYAILDCTSMDARNPLIKEWSILAIRNFCENNPQNQELINNLNKVGDAPNEVLRELNLSLGALRIQPTQLKQGQKN